MVLLEASAGLAEGSADALAGLAVHTALMQT